MKTFAKEKEELIEALAGYLEQEVIDELRLKIDPPWLYGGLMAKDKEQA